MSSAVLPFDKTIWLRHALLTCDEMRGAEALAVERGSLSFYDFMQNAGRAVAQAVIERFAPAPVLVLCGSGNNGGDGYVAAEALRQSGWTVRVAALAPPATPDAQKASAAWQGETVPLSAEVLFSTAASSLIVDALFGTGLTRPLEGRATEVVEAIAARQFPVVSVDVASGLHGDTGAALGPTVQAVETVTFFRKKRGHCLMPGLTLSGEVRVVDTGMREDVLESFSPKVAENHRALWADLLPKMTAAQHKYDKGHALIFGGPEMTGASRLAARAAQRIGAGLVSLVVPPEAWAVYAQALESVLVPKAPDVQALIKDSKRNALLVGPGLGFAVGNKGIVHAALASRKPVVLDADALTLFADDAEVLFDGLHEACVLTPHEGEFSRLFGARIDPQEDKITRAQKAAALTGATVLLKGADTVIASPDGFAVVNTNAPPWLATAGAGDVLAGMIVGLLAGGMPPFAAACAAAHHHGVLAVKHGPGLIAEDLIETITGPVL